MIKRFELKRHRLEEDLNGTWINIYDCIIAEQENMMMGDNLWKLNQQIQKQTKKNGPFDVMIMLKERK